MCVCVYIHIYIYIYNMRRKFADTNEAIMFAVRQCAQGSPTPTQHGSGNYPWLKPRQNKQHTHYKDEDDYVWREGARYTRLERDAVP